MKTGIIIVFILAVLSIGLFAVRSLLNTTSQYSSQYDDIERMAQSDARVNLTPLNNSGVSGIVFLQQTGNISIVEITVENKEFSRFTANMRTGTCSKYAKVQHQLVDGELSTSRTRMTVPVHQLISDNPPLVVVVYNLSGDAIACGDLNQ